MSIYEIRKWRKLLMFLFGIGLFTLLALVWTEWEQITAANRMTISLPSASPAGAETSADRNAAVSEMLMNATSELTPVSTAVSTETMSEPVTESVTLDLWPVYVTGAVERPSLCYLPEHALWQDAVNAAGGFREDAAALYINLAAPIASHQMIYIPSLSEWEEGQTAPPLYPSAAKPSTGGSGAAQEGSGASVKISINHGDASALTEIPGVGEKTAALIISFREDNGPFESIEDLMKIPGIKEAKFAQMKDYIEP